MTHYPRLALAGIGLAAGVLSGCGGESGLVTTAVPLSAVPISYGNGGSIRTTFALKPEEWAPIRARFEPASVDPVQERERIAWALGDFKRVAGTQTPTRGDLACNAGSTIPGGAMDCVDEATNATTYLLVLQQQGLLHWHRVMTQTTRVRWMHTHNAAVIEELPAKTGSNAPPAPSTSRPGLRWAVDTWYGGPTDPAMILPLDDWRELRVQQLGVPAPPPPATPGS